MNNFKKVLLVIFLLNFICDAVYSQTERVGINTTTPRKTLEVNGTTKIDGQIQIGTINAVTSSDTYTFLMQENIATKKIKEIGTPSATNINALGYFLEYEIKTGNDWIQNFDTRILSSKFWVTIVEINFNKTLRYDVWGDHTGTGWTVPYIKATVSGGTWNIIADYPYFNTMGSNPNGTWNIKLLITPKKLARNLGTQTIDLAGAATGVASSPIIN